MPRFSGNFSTGGAGLPRIAGRMERGAGASLLLRLRMAEYRAGGGSLELPELVVAQGPTGSLGFSGATGRFALGPADAPELAARKVELFFDPLRWKPYLVEVRLTDPVVRARIDEQGRVTLPSLQAWLESLGQSKEKSPYVSDDLAVSFTGLRAFLATPGGMVEVDGDARLARMQPVSAALTLKPTVPCASLPTVAVMR